MRSYVVILRRMALRTAAVGTAAGGAFAAREIAAEQFLAHGLWRTALWTTSHKTLAGALLGVGGALFLVLWLRIWRVRPEGTQSQGVSLGERLAGLFAVLAAVAILLSPRQAPPVLGLSHWYAVAAAVGLVWIIVSGYLAEAADQRGEEDADAAESGLLWYQFVGLACVVAVSHVWARALSSWLSGLLIGGCLLTSVAVFRLFQHPVYRLTSWVREATPIAAGSGLRRLPAVVMVSVAAMWLGGWIVGLGTRSPRDAARMNVIVIAVDTLRWDAVSLLSSDEHDRDLTPNLREQLASRATVFSRAYSQAPWTLPSFASIFTGLYPEQHGAEHVWSRLEPQQVTLAEVLREHGYLTMAVMSGHYVTSEVGMTQGFTMSDEELAADARFITSAEVTDRALRFLDARDESPFFLFAHYFDPHVPYVSHPEIDLGPSRGSDRVDIKGYGPGTLLAKPAGKALARLRGSLLPYKEEVAFVDLHVGRLLAYLEKEELWDSTCVVFVADHGEEFFEHGGAGHDNTLFEELVRVPLCLAAPSLDLPEVVSRPVETRWLFGSLLELLRLPSPDSVPRTPSLLAAEDNGGDGYVRSSTRPRGRTGVEGSLKPTVWLTSLGGSRYKLVEDHLSGQGMVFDLAEDPEELHDLSTDRPETTARLRDALAEREAHLPGMGEKGSSPIMGDEQLQRLKSLGYL